MADFNGFAILKDPFEEEREYWEDWLKNTENLMNEMEEIDLMTKELYEVIKVAYDNEQYRPSDDELTDVTRLIRFRIDLSKEEVQKIFGIKVYNIYGVGMYTLMDGLILTPSSRNRSGYDRTGSDRKCSFNFIPEDVRKEHAFNLAVPAMGDRLFVPKKSRLGDWVQFRFNLQFLDLERNHKF